MKRETSINTRLSETERQRLIAAAPDKTMSEAVRAAIALYIQAKAS